MTLRAVLSTPQTGPTEANRSPAFLTVEEAAAVLRIGRTAAYVLARRWEETGGADGLPVVRFGGSCGCRSMSSSDSPPEP